jgi:dihydroorotate dehydrogenase (fumarate)
MDLTTSYLGFDLEHPLIVGASPLVHSLDTVRALEDAGAAAIVMHSLFEEQLVQEQLATSSAIDQPANSYAEALSYFPSPTEFKVGPDQYLEQLRRVKEAVGVPVIGSLNGTSIGGWLEYARLIEDAGADALELNIYDLAIDANESSEAVEKRTLDMIRIVRKTVDVPIAVKLSPFYTALPHFAARLVEAGADGLVLFNRLYQPDINVEDLEVVRLHLSDSSELLLRLHWLAILSGQIDASFAATGGAHTAIDAIKAVMTGAHAVQLVSALLRNGPRHITTIRDHMAAWLEDNEYESLRQMQGSMNLQRCPDPRAYERANYIQLLQSYTPETV